MDPQASLLTAAEARPHDAPASRRPRGSRLLLAIARTCCRLEAFAADRADRRPPGRFAQWLESAQRVSGATWGAALDLEEKGWLTVRIYEDSPACRAEGNDLFDVEAAVFAKRLPPPPARILVGACGTGREAVALAAQGYVVEAFDPAPACVAESRRRLAGRAPVHRLSYEELAALVLDGAGVGAACGGDFDAVVLGCGSLSHVLDERHRRRLLQALHALCPAGPIVASFLWMERLPAGPPPGRAVRLGGRIGRALARWRGMTPAEAAGLSYRARRGFAHTFTRGELEALARAVDRRVAWERHAARASLYATLLPLDAPA